MFNKLCKLSFVTSVSAAALLTACGGGGGDTQQGTLGVSMTDAPACGYDAVNVTVNKVRVHSSSSASENDSGWTDITLNPARKINLLDLTNGVLSELGQTSLPAGHYTQLRLVLDPNNGNSLANSVVLTGGSGAEISLDTPSAVQSGIKLINGFDVAAGQKTDLVLDFDACKSIVTKGNGKYALKPVIKVIPTVLNGIDGYVNTALLSDHVMVTAQQNGVVVSGTVPDPTTGKFFLARLVPGDYDVVITADKHAAAVIAKVPVASTTSTVSLSTSGAAINLPSDSSPRTIQGTVTTSPVNTSDDVAFVAAKQTFSSGPTVTIKYRGADVLTGAYTLEQVPSIAPQFGQYSATLPITLATTTPTPGAGKYNVDASLSGYVTKSATVDVSSANATQDFALTK